MSQEELINIRNEVKSYIAKSGYTLTYIVEKMNESRDAENKTTTQNISNKLSRGTIKYSEIKKLLKLSIIKLNG